MISKKGDPETGTAEAGKELNSKTVAVDNK